MVAILGTAAAVLAMKLTATDLAHVETCFVLIICLSQTFFDFKEFCLVPTLDFP